MLSKHLIVLINICIFSFLLSACSESDSGTQQQAVAAITEPAKTSKADTGQKPDQTAVAPQEQAQATVKEPETPAEEKVSAIVAATSDKPYRIVDGKISANALEGWKTYNGGGCGTCHGKGGAGAVGPNIAMSVATKITQDDFKSIVTNGRPGTLMRPNKTNKRVMDNLDNLYTYLLARGDGVLGPGNLIKFPFGKSE